MRATIARLERELHDQGVAAQSTETSRRCLADDVRALEPLAKILAEMLTTKHEFIFASIREHARYWQDCRECAPTVALLRYVGALPYNGTEHDRSAQAAAAAHATLHGPSFRSGGCITCAAIGLAKSG